ncbi:hypothetical protein PgNI_10195 [Pyricularia grisea]|uniref:Uncharacterized protein n=1 Tax=Pyricularia grisea TaxID=148305 RepID=A0A6P8AZT2_PYRGI|nr:hypothetical protein PgNI_10195 [Pyricularia grisea]TLD07736.1 hypothetical protein PgNI_10195 [Pyricularia grisea]
MVQIKSNMGDRSRMGCYPRGYLPSPLHILPATDAPVTVIQESAPAVKITLNIDSPNLQRRHEQQHLHLPQRMVLLCKLPLPES